MSEAKQPESGKEDNRLSTVVALLIAAVSVAGAVVTWRASVSADAAGDADVAGIRATINLTESNALAAVKGYSDYAAFTEYYKYRETGSEIEKGAQLVILEAMKMEHAIVAPRDGVVETVNCREGEMVQPGVDLVTMR